MYKCIFSLFFGILLIYKCKSMLKRGDNMPNKGGNIMAVLAKPSKGLIVISEKDAKLLFKPNAAMIKQIKENAAKCDKYNLSKKHI